MDNYLTVVNNVVVKCDEKAEGVIYIPEGITEIGDMAFCNCRKVTKVVLPDTTTIIGEHVFSCCENLVECVLKNPKTYIKSGAFLLCSNLQHINFQNIIKIGNRAFYGCENLTDVYIPDTLTNIKNDAFERCEKLENIIVDKNNPTYKDINGVLYRKRSKELMIYPCGRRDTTYIIPEDTKEIGCKAFMYAVYLEDITIPEGIWNLKMFTFSCCSKLKTVHLPDTMKWIGLYCFCDCPNLININMPNAMELIGWGSFQDCTKLRKLNIPKHTFVTSPLYTFRGTKVPHIKPGLYREYPAGITNIEKELSFDWKKVPNMFLN